MDTQITKEKSIVIKVIAVMMMVALHVFNFPSRIFPYTYIGLGYINGNPIEQYLAQAFSIVVNIFLFVTGYGLYIKRVSNYKEVFKYIIRLYLKYWSIFLIFIPLGYFMEIYKFNIKEFLLNFLSLNTTYNLEWWFLKQYIIYLITYPLIKKYIKKFPSIVLGISIVVTLAGMFLTLCLQKKIINYSYFLDIIIIPTLATSYSFISGIYIAKQGLFNRLNKIVNKFKINKKLFFIILLFLLIIIERLAYIKHILNFILVPLFIFSLSGLNLEQSRFILKLGNYTTGIWLIHSFFCYYYFKNIVFFPKYSILVFIWIMFLSIISTIIIEKIEKKLMKVYRYIRMEREK